MYYFGTSNNRNGVAVILEREWHDKILKVDRISDRIINVKLAQQPFHRDLCDILTKNNILLVPNLYNNYSGPMKL